MISRLDGTLEGRKGLVVGIANAHSIAYGFARAFRALGAELAVTYLNDKSRPYVEPLAQELQAPIILPCDVQDDVQVDGLFAAIRQRRAGSTSPCTPLPSRRKPDLQGRLTDSSREGFLMAMDISCHSFIRLALRRAADDRRRGALDAQLRRSREGGPNYDLMGPVKACWSARCGTWPTSWARKASACMPSPPARSTPAASGSKDFDAIVLEEQRKAPLGRLAETDDVGRDGRLPGKPGGAITGMTIYVDGGYHIMG